MKLKWLKDKLGEKFYPIAHARGVVVTENKTLDSKLTEIDKDIKDNGYGEVAGGKNLVHNTINGATALQFNYALTGIANIPKGVKVTISFIGSSGNRVYNDTNLLIPIFICTGKKQSFTATTQEEIKGKFVIFKNGENNTVVPNFSEVQIELGSESTSYEPYFPSNKMIGEEAIQQSTEIMDIKMLGWSVPRECPVQNEVNGNQFIQKVGRVDSSTLDWSYQTENTRFIASIPSDMKQTAGTRVANIMYLYGYKTISDGSDIGSISNKSIYISNNMLVIHDSAYTDASAFKSAMQGKYLYYELATPITTTIDGNEIGETVSDLRGDMYFEKEISLAKAQLIRNGSYSDINIISSLFLFGANGKFGLSRGYISLSIPVSFSKKDEIYIKLPYKQYGYKKDDLLPYIYKTVFCTQGDLNGKIIGTCNLSYYSGSDDEGISLTIDINDNYSFTDDNISSAYVNLRF